MKTPHADWSWDEVLAALHSEGLTLRGLAARHGLEAQAIGCVQFRPSPLSQTRFADALGVAPQQIWPSRYEADGSPLSRKEGHGRWMGKTLAVRDSALRKLAAARRAYARGGKSTPMAEIRNVETVEGV
jgi:Ner family transcriptional regulator